LGIARIYDRILSCLS